MPRLRAFPSHAPGELHTDASEGDIFDEVDDDDLDDLERDMERAATAAFNEREYKRSSDTTAKRVDKHLEHEWHRIGLPKLSKDPKASERVVKWRTENVNRITGMQKDQIEKVRNILDVGQGRRVESLAEDIERQLDDVSASRAELIARDQVLKLNGELTQDRHEAAGIEKYWWSTSQDERVRPTHADLEGELFSWDDPPETNDNGDRNHPGGDFSCRCVATPFLEELEEEGLGME